MKMAKWKAMNKINHMFDNNIFPNFSDFSPIGSDLAVDVYEKANNIIAKMSLPGVEVGEIDISIEDNILTISGSREEEGEIDQDDYYSKEIRRGSFLRSISLPKSVDADKAEATYEKGELSISIPTITGIEDTSVKVKITS